MEQLYASVIVDISHEKLDRAFQYIVPGHLRASLKIGMVAMVPFGKGNRLIKGYVIELTEQSQYDTAKMKEIDAIVTEETGVEAKLIALAGWMRDYYGSTMIQALKTVIPIKQKVKPKEKKYICLIVTPEEAIERLAFYQKKHQTARARLLEALIETSELPTELVTGKLNISAATIKALESQGVIGCKSQRFYRNPLQVAGPVDYQLRLNEEQRAVTDAILGEWEERRNPTYLLHGVTGSGKTEIYMEIIAHAIARGKQAIVLIPEIALTYQMVMRFYRRFGERISILNSRLTPGERYDQFLRAREGLIDVMIGPRSALFTPFQNLGVIIMDEEHEDSYKSETTPRYQTRETAVKRGEIEGAKVILGSATPSMEAYYRAKKGEYTLFTIKNRVQERTLPNVHTIDMRKELNEHNRSIISRTLRSLMVEKLSQKQQIMLFLNRRGYAGFLSCRSCGHTIICPHCDVSLAIHNHGRLTCHYCGYQTLRPETCPKCESTFLREFRIGTQQVEALIQKEFPEAKVLRMDMDTTKEKNGHEKILAAFANQEADILVGTQMIVKGHDFPQVTLVGILAADMSLHAGDYRASERTFQLLTQAAGRAGRGSAAGEVVIQTYDPENYSIVLAARQDYERFYEQEILFRELAGYPPAAGLLVIHGAGAEEAHLQLAMDYLKKFLDTLVKNGAVRVIGPAEEAVAKVNDIFKKVIYVKHPDTKTLIIIKNKVEQYIEMNDGYNTVNIQFDMN